MSNQLTEKEYKRIKQYIINPMKVGLWETTFSLIPLEKDSLLSKIRKSFQQSQQIANYPNIITILSNFANSQIYQPYNISSENNNNIKEIITTYNIQMIQNYLTIDNEFIFISENNNNYNNNHIKFLSLHKTLGENLAKIFKKLNYATLEKEEKRFSPKSILFQPYFYYTQIISDTLFSSTQEELNYFNRAITSYTNNSQQYTFNTSHQCEESIRMIGKAFESTLTHIYETLLRKV